MFLKIGYENKKDILLKYRIEEKLENLDLTEIDEDLMMVGIYVVLKERNI